MKLGETGTAGVVTGTAGVVTGTTALLVAGAWVVVGTRGVLVTGGRVLVGTAVLVVLQAWTPAARARRATGANFILVVDGVP